MKNFAFLSVFIFINLVGKAQTNQKFTTTTFKDLAWFGDTTSWKLQNNQLVSNNQTANSSFFLSDSVSVPTHGTWKVKVNLKFSTSSLNYVDVWLSGNNKDLTKAEGYFVRIGSTDDDICLYKKIGTTNTKLIDGVNGRSQLSSSDNQITILVNQTPAQGWTLTDSANAAGFVNEGTSADTTLANQNFIGFLVKQSTASFFGKHSADYYNVSPYSVDKIPPKLISYSKVNNKILLLFDENLGNIQASDISFKNNTVKSFSVEKDSIWLEPQTFSNPFSDSIFINNLSDKLGNKTSFILKITFYNPQKYDVVLSEIFSDPSPVIGLPEVEFIELYNNSQFDISLHNWKICDASACYTIPSCIIKADSSLVFTASVDVSKFGISNIVGMTIPSLNNSGDSLKLFNEKGELQEVLSYSLSTYQNVDKQEGGWTLEKIDPKNHCAGNMNWKASINTKGGTPGFKNSVNGIWLPSVSPSISQSYVKDNQLIIKLSVPIDNTKLGNQKWKNGVSADFTSITIQNVEFSGNDGYYVLDSLLFCGNNSFQQLTAHYWITDTSAIKKVFLNEILFNPFSGGADFVELYNSAEKAADLSYLQLRNSKGDKMDFPLNAVILPKSYLAITTNVSNLKSNYKAGDNVLELSKLPSMNDDEGDILFTDSTGKVLDSFVYSYKMHLPELKNEEGISLEKTNPNVPANQALWVSCATQLLATPALANSQNVEELVKNQKVEILPKVISPNGDGFNDFMAIQVINQNINNLGNIKIFSAAGRLVKEVLTSSILPTKGLFHWDGADQYGNLVPNGQYVLFVEVVSAENGEKELHKLPVGVWVE